MKLYKFRNYNSTIKYSRYKVVILRFMRKIMYLQVQLCFLFIYSFQLLSFIDL